MERYVRYALERWEPRITLARVLAVPDNDNGRATIEVDYVIRSTNDTRNLVFPFYFREGGLP